MRDPIHRRFILTPARLAVLLACRDLLARDGHPPGPAAIARLNGTRSETVARQVLDLQGYGYMRGYRLTEKGEAALASMTTGGEPVQGAA